MLLPLCISCLLLASHIRANQHGTLPENEDAGTSKGADSKKLWKLVFNTYYHLNGMRNETTDEMVNAFFDHGFEPYPKDLYPSFQKILEHISKSNDRIWNFYESILYLYHNVAAADRIYETVLTKFALGRLCLNFLKESKDAEETLPLDERSKAEYADLEHRTGAVFEEEEFVSEWLDQPCEDDCGVPPLQVGSFRGIPGVHFPNYDEIPITSFTCADKHIPGFYADLETGCQVFHVCYDHRRESFLCPIGTIFNQAILACDYWYSSNCSLSPLYFNSNPLVLDDSLTDEDSLVDDLLTKSSTPATSTESPADFPTFSQPSKPKSPKIQIVLPNIDWALMIKFLPIKSKIIEYPEVCETTTYPTRKPTIVTEPTYPTHEPTYPTRKPTIVTEPTYPAHKPTYPTRKPTIVTEPTYPTRKPTIVTEPTYPTRKPTYPTRKPTIVTEPTYPTRRPTYPTRKPTIVTEPTYPTRKPTYPTHKPTIVTKPTKTTPPYITKPTVPPKKVKDDIKTAKSEILLDILKAVEELTRDAKGFLTEMNIGKIIENKHKHKDVRPRIKVVPKPPKVNKPVMPARKPILEPRYPTKPFPEINQRFVVRPVTPVKILPRPTVFPSKTLKPAKQIVDSKVKGHFRKKDSAKLIVEGMKAIAHMLH